MSTNNRASRRGALVFCLLLLAACGRAPELSERHFSGDAIGTSYNVKIVAQEITEDDAESAREIVSRGLEFVDSRMSTYREDSELSRLNRAAADERVAISPELARLLASARQIGAATGGAFDVTVGPLVNAWGFGPDGKPDRVPDDATLARLSEITGWDKLEIDDSAPVVVKSAGGVFCDLSGVAKGYVVDRISDQLLDAGFANHMVEVGGEVRVRGVNRQGKPWSIGIETPVVSKFGVQKVLPMRDMAMATSGDYRNFFELNGIRYSHIIDPRTGEPIRHRLASVSVVEEVCTQADGFATALMVLGENEGYAAAVQYNLAALFLIRELDGSFTERATPRFTALFGAAGQKGESP